MVITIFYPFSSKLKFIYFEFKNIYSKDGKYLKHFSENGLWIKDEINNKIYIINGSEKKDDFLTNVFISEFDSDFNLTNNFSSKKVDISSNTWILEDPILFKDNKQVLLDENMTIRSHFDSNKINKSFRNLNSLNVIQLIKEKEENRMLGYSSEEIDLHILKIVSLPIYFSIMVVISSIIMLNIKKDKPYIFHILLGITLSVIIYYISNIFDIFGLTNKIPIYLSVFFPIIILSIISTLGLVRINEK
ncbi:LptF/LptG family permease [Pelagibacterales bacterium SAG-MED38]|nr:LptF/LptG family permease [Pelagibacterales bacterium SAG-MED38]